jgi:hypothetical protein
MHGQNLISSKIHRVLDDLGVTHRSPSKATQTVDSESIRQEASIRPARGNPMRISTIILASVLAASTACHAQTAGQDMKSAGTDTKAAAKDTGHATATGAKKVYHKTTTGTKNTAHKVADSKAGENTRKAATTTGHATKTAATKTAHATENAGDKVAGKPADH